MGGFAWVTLATNDSYSLGALVLAHSLRRVNTAHHLVALITPGVTEAMKTQLSAVFDVVKLVDVLDSGDADNLALLARPELGITFTKLHCWKLTDYDKCVFLDADTLILQNSDELFEREELSAAPDAGWPDCFNSGVFVYRPSNETFKSLIEFALIHGSFDGGDQGLLNLFFSDWPTKDIKKHLPFVYNMCSTSTYSYLPAFKQFGKGLKIIHFIGAAKPWLQPFNTETALARVSGESQHVTQFVQFWWDLFCTHVHPSLSTEMTRHRLSSSYVFMNSAQSAPTFSSVQSNYGELRTSSPPPFVKTNHHKNESYTYYDPWDELIDQNKSHEVSFHNHNNADSYLVANETSNNEYVSERRDSNKSDSRHHHSVQFNHLPKLCGNVDHSNHSHRPSESVVERGRTYPDATQVSDNVELWSRPSKLNSFSQPERSVSAPEIKMEQPVVVLDLHLHDPPTPVTTNDSPHSERSSVENHPQEHSQSDAGLAAALATVTLGAPLSTEQTALEEHLRRQGWEQGNIDYMGKDSFANIWGKICDTLASSTRLSPMPTEEAPTPVAPVAAPVFVSSVEMSPTGPIDTSPPANYAPVSASKTTTVVASDIEAATKAAPSETATVIPEPKSPSVTELVSTEASISSTAALDTSAQPSTSVSAVSEPSATVSQREASTSLTPSSSSTVLTETAPVLVAQIPAVETFPVASAPVTTISSGLIPAVLPPATILPTTDSTSASIVPIPTSAEIPVSVQPTLKDTPVSTSQTQVTVIAISTETLLPKPVEVSEPITPTSTETLIPKPTESSGSILHTPKEIPVSSSQILSPVPDTPPKTSVSSTVPPSKTPVTTTKAEVEAPAHVPPTPSVVPAPIASAPVATESNVESTPASTESIPSTVSTAPPSKPSDVGAQVPVQPDTPTVTEPTPPTSPPAAPVEAPLAAKLQVETEVPATPPVGSSSTQPSLAAAPTEEPPIPPKRKGGSKATQEVKNQKGGKQTKSKK